MSNQHLPTASMVRCPSCDGTGLIPTHKQAEIDRLRDELVELRPYCETLNRRLMEAGDELKRLRAENAELKIALQRVRDGAANQLRQIARNALAKTAKEGE